MECGSQAITNILVVDDNKQHLELMVELLAEAEDTRVFAAGSGEEALQVLGGEDIQIVLLDVIMPGMDGLAVCRKIRENPKTAMLQIVLLSGFDEKRDLDELFALGADDFISKPIAPLELYARVQAALIRYKSQPSRRYPFQVEELSTLKAENVSLRQKYKQIRNMNQDLEKNNQELQQLASIDPLSGLLNRRTLFKRLEVEIERSLRLNLPLTGIMADIDHFKRVNDNYGHQCGDMVIRDIGIILRKTLRKYDYAGRYGGEEFFVIFPNTNLESALTISERFRREIEQSHFPCVREALNLTISIGISQFRPGEVPDDWVGRADIAMYRAKQLGRNQIASE